jgi:hypothetical protein
MDGVSRRRLVVLGVVVVAVVVAFFVLRGDGGGGQRAVTHAELVAEVDDVCVDLISTVTALEPPYRPYDATSETFFANALTAVEDAKGRLRDVDPPEGDAAAHQTLVEGYTRIETHLEEAQGAAAVEQDPEVATRIDEIEATTKPMVDAEQALGACKGGTSVAALPGLLGRTVPNPLSETGEP